MVGDTLMRKACWLFGCVILRNSRGQYVYTLLCLHSLHPIQLGVVQEIIVANRFPCGGGKLSISWDRLQQN